MASHKPTMSVLHLLLFLVLHVLPLASPAVDQFTFDGFAGANLSLDGTAVVTPDGLLMLTNGTTQLKGHAFYPSPLRFHEATHGSTSPRSFSTAFVFGIASEYEDLSSPGLAFVVSKSNDFSTALQSQYMGLANAANNGNASNHFLAVELDTVFNAEFGDMSGNHVGIDVDGLSSLVADNAGYYEDGTGAFRNMSLLNRTAAQVWVDFDARTSLLSVTMAPLELPKPKKPLLSATVNLSSVTQDNAYVGFSSSTGVVSSRHYVLAWSFKMDGGQAPPLNTQKLPALPWMIPNPKRRSKTLYILLPIASAALVLALAITVVVVDRRRRKYAEVKEDWETEFGPHRFSYKDLFHATKGFSDERLLGVGGFGRVYKGALPMSGTEVAVKKVSHESRQGMKEFISEVVSIGKIRHRSLVQLLGYCRRRRELLLVYDHMPNGSLDKFLYDHSTVVLSWRQRVGIINDVASSVLYLHEEWEQVVLHRDIKASNVLLDAGMNGRLGDFGLARLYDHGTDPHTTHVVGTMGYLAPELGHTGKASKASDIFAFGVFMLEVACGRRPISQDEHGDHLLLADRVMEHWREGTIADAVDPRLRGDFPVEEASLVLKLCLLCSHPLPSARPGIRQIMQFLDGRTPLPEVSVEHLSVNMQALMQNQVVHSHSLPSTIAGNISDIPGGRY